MASQAHENGIGEQTSPMACAVVKRREIGMSTSTRIPQVGTRQFLDEIFGIVDEVLVEPAEVKIWSPVQRMVSALSFISSHLLQVVRMRSLRSIQIVAHEFQQQSVGISSSKIHCAPSSAESDFAIGYFNCILLQMLAKRDVVGSS
jgi:hypothetical protein